jgi:hypothetical protein
MVIWNSHKNYPPPAGDKYIYGRQEAAGGEGRLQAPRKIKNDNKVILYPNSQTYFK